MHQPPNHHRLHLRRGGWRGKSQDFISHLPSHPNNHLLTPDSPPLYVRRSYDVGTLRDTLPQIHNPSAIHMFMLLPVPVSPVHVDGVWTITSLIVRASWRLHSFTLVILGRAGSSLGVAQVWTQRTLLQYLRMPRWFSSSLLPSYAIPTVPFYLHLHLHRSPWYVHRTNAPSTSLPRLAAHKQARQAMQ